MLSNETQSEGLPEQASGFLVPLDLVIAGTDYQWDRQFISGREIRGLAGLPDSAELFLSVVKPWDDEPVGVDDVVDLAREGIEYFYVCKPLKFILNDKEFGWKHQYIACGELKRLAGAEERDEVLLLFNRPFEDEIVADGARVDLARPGIEHFRVRKKGEEIKVSIRINDKEYKVKRGKHTVVALKQLAGIPLTDELSEVIDGKLTPLADDATVHIKGGEEFFSCKRGGSSS